MDNNVSESEESIHGIRMDDNNDNNDNSSPGDADMDIYVYTPTELHLVSSLFPIEYICNTQENVPCEIDLIKSEGRDLLISSLLKRLYDLEFDGMNDIIKKNAYMTTLKLMIESGLVRPEITNIRYDIPRNNIIDNLKSIIEEQKRNFDNESKLRYVVCNSSHSDESELSKSKINAGNFPGSHVAETTDKYKINSPHRKIFRHAQQTDIFRRLLCNQKYMLMERSKTLYRNFNVIRQIAAGGYGTIHEIRSMIDGKTYALKRTKYDDKSNDKWNLEVRIMSELQHPNIIKYYASWIDFGFSDKSTKSYCNGSEKNQKSDIYIYIQMELCDTDLAKLLKRYTFTERKYHIYDLFKQILAGIRYIHSKNIIHRDLKPSNILIKLINDNICVRISDFGGSKIVDQHDNHDHTYIMEKKDYILMDTNMYVSLSSEYVGTINYIAPEITKGYMYGYNADVYSLGIILFELLTDFKTVSEKHDVLRNLHRYLEKNNILHNIISDMIITDPKCRPSVSDILLRWGKKDIKRAFRMINN